LCTNSWATLQDRKKYEEKAVEEKKKYDEKVKEYKEANATKAVSNE
jgi:hypothetical protein